MHHLWLTFHCVCESGHAWCRFKTSHKLDAENTQRRTDARFFSVRGFAEGLITSWRAASATGCHGRRVRLTRRICIAPLISDRIDSEVTVSPKNS